ncbi:alpha/beta fold hydrolase [Roseibium sp. MMSF_3412]|uniref:alpha/beta fold hydrolase n=1 Tax=Roseibium sp. MMSF_3412 TaxID=3046712 RepID=UPI00273F6233|nr:alpha/beta hydrolase [Roseibium sp. MMSF_3412]
MLHYRQSKPNQQKTIVFLHAAGFDGRIWKQAAEQLDDFHCVCPDLPGHGQSKAIQVTDFDAASDAVAELVGSLGGDPVCLAGLSMGSYIGFRLLARHPHLVESAVFSGFQHKPIEVSGVMRALMHASSFMMNSRKNREKMARSLGVNDPSLVSQRGGRPNASSKTMRKISSLALDFDVSIGLQAIETRTLVLAGETEHPAILSSLPALQSGMPQCTARIVPGLGHGWIATEPDLYAETLRAWFLQKPLPEGLKAVTAD